MKNFKKKFGVLLLATSIITTNTSGFTSVISATEFKNEEITQNANENNTETKEEEVKETSVEEIVVWDNFNEKYKSHIKKISEDTTKNFGSVSDNL
ncbi:hypothetical protein FACS189465_3260 [Clostridia bacterium]|nr:hypothetical protein FACS189465_3260 [Clostridia bacterium]